MDVLSFFAGAVTVFTSLIIGYFIGKGKPPENIIGNTKRALTGAQGAVLQEPEPDDEQTILKREWDDAKRKNPFAKPPEGLRKDLL